MTNSNDALEFLASDLDHADDALRNALRDLLLNDIRFPNNLDLHQRRRFAAMRSLADELDDDDRNILIAELQTP